MPNFSTSYILMTNHGQTHIKSTLNSSRIITTVDGVAFFKGTTGLNLRSQDSLWWLGISADIKNIRSKRTTCHTNAPTRPPLPPVQPPQSDYLFQLVSTDYFALSGHSYLVLVDRYGNWPVIKQCKN